MFVKKYVRILVLVIAVVLVSGCGNKVNDKEIVKTCKSTASDVASGYKVESEYKVYAKGDVVEKVETTEIVTSDDEELLDYFEEYLEDTYESTNEVYGGYTNNVTNENGKVISTTTIDYNVMNIEQYVKDNTAMTNYVNSNNEILLEGILNLYEGLGAVCE